ncbi:hypothetical protein ANOM_003327 [Aspergillus nomiae NRRL 13137]|uniref:Uncharacterized protein n=1 Tax=Aspergillus nomiae NRRL (strain ATCC 15546 / NRRL 13137 / CBS 260.88 / M93) TaxID=1509407 RepID=A0A0L1J9G4_ASPN3|nr:uncharacterized protein ANOM_003327 [Aspergillus nomiae NRRL 13137]KNG88389.1 hypothetical protein ANOM_003327 [Aspergillus nomiae NRRL 13137]
MSQPVGLTDSRIVMAEKSSHDVVNQTLSGGEPSPSDVPASTNDKKPAGGDVGEIKYTATTTQLETITNAEQGTHDTSLSETYSEKNATGRDTEQSTTDISRQGPGPVATRALELNGVASGSDFGEDTASQGGSESDASRTESRLNSRASSTKRPTSFKPVSFAKFSVPKAPGTPSTAKIAEKAPLSSTTPLGVPLQSSRPRLVAKTTSSLRDSLSKTGTSAARPAGSGPDPNQVWNKNRPIQQTPPKHLTDEELKQQYGIHMTSRIQEDGGGTEAKWADIDDDEDDWAPETIEWTDGTKTNLSQVEHTAATKQESKPSMEPKNDFPPPRPEQVPAIKEATKFVPKPTTSVGPNPTVLRLGANAERQAKSASISSKGTNEKSPSLSTSPAPPPAKSPWAPLPPVEKMSPVIPPVQVQPQVHTSSREPLPIDRYSGVTHPKEIAADDFNRSWKDSQSGTRELYNSRSGRYEPVSETRKGSWRTEQSFRTPSVLQRPVPGEQAGPAEPSPAFQTHRSSGQDGIHWTRRRTSSNVSGGSGSFARRMSIGRTDATQRSFEIRRGSQANGMVEPPLPGLVPQQETPLREPSPARRGPGHSWTQRGAAGVQEGAPDGTSQPYVPHAVNQTATPQAPQEDPVVMQERIMKEKRMEARQRRIEQEEKEEAAKRERIRQKLEALGPPPEKPKAQRKDTLEGMERAAEKSSPTANARRAPSPPREPKPDTTTTNGLQQPGDSQTQTPEKLSENKLDEQSTQWRGGLNASSSYPPWAPNAKLVGTSPSIANPWKPLSSDKTLGNGIFEQSLPGFPPGRDVPLRNPLVLDQPPVAPGSQSFSTPSRSPQESTPISPIASPKARHAPYESLNPIARPGPIGPPSSQHQWQHDNRVAGTVAWNNFHTVAAKREAEENDKLRNEMNATREGPSSLQVTFNETWRQVRTGDQAGQRQVVGISRTADANAAIPPNPLPGLDHPVGPLPFTEANSRPLGSVPVRSSRFFPQASEQYKKPPFAEGDFIRSPSPPPPEEMSTHPVFTGNTSKPLVHLPAPRPIVKLPPKLIAPPQPPPTFASMAAAPPRPPVSTATSWQEKINTLFGKKTVPERKTALAVTSASKEPLDVLHIAAVSVSLPQHGEQPIGDGEITAKQVEETEEIFEDREVGSLPVVRVPTRAPPAAWQAAPPPSQSRLRAKHLKLMQVHSVEPYSFGFHDKDGTGNLRVSIRFPGTIIAKTVALPRKAGSQNPRPRGTSSYKPRKNTKPREGSVASTSKKSSSQQNNETGSPRHQSRNASWGPRTYSGSR